MAFNRGIDADLTKIYNGQYGLPFNNGETYTNPSNQTFTFVELTTTENLDLLPGFPIGDGGGILDTTADGAGRIMGVWQGDGKSACIAAAGAAKKGVWVQSGGLVAGDVWTRIANLDGPDSATPNSGIRGSLYWTGGGHNTNGSTTPQVGVLQGAAGAFGSLIREGGVIDGGGPSAIYGATGAGGAIQNASTAIVRGVPQTGANILLLQSLPGNATSQGILDGYTIGEYLNIGDKDLSAGSGGGKNAITIKLNKAITDQSGNRVGLVGIFQSATDASDAAVTKLYHGSTTNTTAASGSYTQVDGVGDSGTNATAVSTDEEYTDMTSVTAGLDFYIGLLGTTARLTL